MEDDSGPSVDDILEAERAGKLDIYAGGDALPEDNEPPSGNEPDLDEDSDAETADTY